MSKLILTKTQKIKISAYTVLILGTIVFGVLFRINYSRYMAQDATASERAIEEVGSKTTANLATIPVHTGTLFLYGGLFVLFSMATGLTLGRLLSGFVAEKVVNTLHGTGDACEFIKKADYEKAEEEWAKSNFVEAIELFREYLRENPNEIHAAIRIAEIYEKDLENYLAAAMEYEEILKQKLPDEQWGWTAIHLCNLYIGKLDRPQDAVNLMKRIARDYEFTAAAVKARQHLDRLGEEYENGIPLTEEEDEENSSEEEENKKKWERNSPASEQFKRRK